MGITLEISKCALQTIIRIYLPQAQLPQVNELQGIRVTARSG